MLMVDEGHVAGTATVDAMRFARMLNIERSWVVTGSKYRAYFDAASADIQHQRDIFSKEASFKRPLASK
jgi:hypothetical protein